MPAVKTTFPCELTNRLFIPCLIVLLSYVVDIPASGGVQMVLTETKRMGDVGLLAEIPGPSPTEGDYENPSEHRI